MDEENATTDDAKQKNEQSGVEGDPSLPPELLEEIQWYNKLTQTEIKRLIVYDDSDYASDIEHHPQYLEERMPTLSFEQMD